THFSSVLLPEPLGPIRPWNSFSPTVRSTLRRAMIRPKALVTARVSSSGIVCSFADPLRIRRQESDQPGRSEQDEKEQQQPEHNGPDLGKAIGEPEAWGLDRDYADDRADQRADAAEQRVEDDLRG